MSSSHHHHHHGSCADESADRQRLLFAFVIIFVFMIVEFFGGLLSGSLALMADAGHMATDAGALFLALMAKWLTAKSTDADRFPYGLKRAQVLAGFLNGVGLIVLVAWLFWESAHRMFNPQEISAGLMLTVAVLGLGANIAAFYILHRGNMEDLNMRGAMLHVLADIFGSAAAIISALVIMATGWVTIDVLLTVIVSALILRSAFPLLNDAARVLLQGAPRDFDSEEMIGRLKAKVPAISNIHELQIWMLTPQDPRLVMHIQVDGPSRAQAVLHSVKEILATEYNIHHSTIQVECPDCPDENIFHNDPDRNSSESEETEPAAGHYHKAQEASA
ncbi:cation diffusion facilitator family transporter [Parvularcula sp. IMCC14364]|uniref:cation diffusion facilitator family transporter n=1 Tax=Parvularcula sp. IMCC14364 TaxID=3067902 RepID=UPI002741B71E|nr:cation diffusion facilitator family transporter [Parvularcula sp. IMCC14364]